MISTNQFKNGNHIEVEGTIFKILEFQHVKPGKGGAFVRTKLRRSSDGAVIDRTFRAGEKFRSVRTEARKMQFLYADGTDAHFMDSESFEQLAIPEPAVGETLKWVKPERGRRPAVHRRRAGRHPAVGVRRARGHPHRAGRQGRHRVGRRQQARDARDRRDRQRAAVRQHRRPHQGRHALGQLHVARVTDRARSRRSEQRRAAAFALYQHEVARPPARRRFERDAAGFTRALAHATADYQDGARRGHRRARPRLVADRIAPLERAILRVALLEMLHPEVADADTPIPPEGAIDEAVETAKAYCGAEAPGFVNGILGAALRERAS